MLEGGAELLLTEMKDDDLLRLVALDVKRRTEESDDVPDEDDAPGARAAATTGSTTTEAGAASRRTCPSPSANGAGEEDAAGPAEGRAARCAPVEIDGRKIAATFWGGAWCENLERYSDYANRLPRGRTYVRNGSVIDLQIGAGRVDALVSGSEIYTVVVQVDARAAGALAARSAGAARARSTRSSSCCRAAFRRA